ncbi:MAG: hypothetical protein Q9217_005922, partial [Psora testacea]
MRTRRSGGSATSSLTTPPDSDPQPTLDEQTPSPPNHSINPFPAPSTTLGSTRSPPTPLPPANLTLQQQAAAAKNPALGPKYRRMATLKAHFAGVTKALKPGLRELATRTERKLRQNDGDNDGLVVIEGLMQALDQNWRAKKARLRREMDLIKAMKGREFNELVAEREMAYRRKVE